MRTGDEYLLPWYISVHLRAGNSWPCVLGKTVWGHKIIGSTRESPVISCAVDQRPLNEMNDDASMDAEHSVNGTETASPAMASSDMRRGCRWTSGVWQWFPLPTIRADHHRVDEAKASNVIAGTGRVALGVDLAAATASMILSMSAPIQKRHGRSQMLLHAFLLIILSGMSAAHARQDELTLEAFITEVTAANPALSAAEQRTEAIQRRIKPASTLDDPFVAFGVDEIPFGEQRVELYRYQASQSFPFPGKLRAREAVATQRAKISEYGAETQRREFTVIATQQFYRAFYNNQAAELNQQLQGILRASMQSAKARYEAGGADHHDWLLAKLELATLSVEQQRIERERLFLQATINELRGRRPEDHLEKIAVDLSDHNTDDVEASLDEQPEVAALDAQATQAGDEYKLAKLGYYPDIVVQAMAMQPRDAMGEEESNWGVMVGINVPLYSWRKQSNLVAAARHEQHAVEMDKLYLRNRLRTEIVNASQALASARQMVALYEHEVLPSTQSALANAQSGYQARRMELAKYLSILRIQKTQQLELIAARIDVQLAKTRMRELLSTPPLLQLAPSRPTVFGSGDMGGGMQSSDAVSMGSGMSAAKKTGKGTGTAAADGASVMGGMQ